MNKKQKIKEATRLSAKEHNQGKFDSDLSFAS